MLTVSVWLAPFVLAGALFLPAYNLELIGGRLHGDLWFALGWGAFPALTGLLRQRGAGSLRPALLIAAGCLAHERGPAALELTGARAAQAHAAR